MLHQAPRMRVRHPLLALIMLAVAAIWAPAGAASPRADGRIVKPPVSHAAPAKQRWVALPAMNFSHDFPGAAVLPDGRVFVVGGTVPSTPPSTASTGAELSNRAHTAWSVVGDMSYTYDTATVLANGDILVAGGFDTPPTSAQLFDPNTGQWSNAGIPPLHTGADCAARLHDGRVLLLSAYNLTDTFGQIYSPTTNSWTTTAPITDNSGMVRCLTIPDGRVLAYTGDVAYGVSNLVHLYNPASATWSADIAITNTRYLNTVTVLKNGKLLITGANQVADIFDPGTGQWTPTAPSPYSSEAGAMAARLADGDVLVTVGLDSSGIFTSNAEVYDPASNTWTAGGAMSVAHDFGAMLNLPDGGVLAVGGETGPDQEYSFDGLPISGVDEFLPRPRNLGQWSWATTAMIGGYGTSAGQLANGNVIVVLCYDESNDTTTKIYHAATGVWSTVAPLPGQSCNDSLVGLRDGRVLLVGFVAHGSLPYLRYPLYNPRTNTWGWTSPVPELRAAASVTMLPGGNVFIAGGYGVTTTTSYNDAIIYHPATNRWTIDATAPFSLPVDGIAVTLKTGDVLIASSTQPFWDYESQADLWTRGAQGGPGSWFSATLPQPLDEPSVTVSRNGNVLVAGGTSTGISSAEVYIPGPKGVVGAWSPTGGMTDDRLGAGSLLLPDGRVLVVGGSDMWNGGFGCTRGPCTQLTSAELYDPRTNGWQGVAPMLPQPTTTSSYDSGFVAPYIFRLPNGSILVVGSRNDFPNQVELFIPPGR